MNAIFKTWFPLSLTWLLMAAEGPIIASFIARLEGSKENLAAYGVAFSMGLLMEAPVVMIMSAAVKLVKDSVSYFSLRNYTFLLCLAVSAVYGISMIPSVFKLWTQDFMGLTSNVSELTFLAMAMLLSRSIVWLSFVNIVLSSLLALLVYRVCLQLTLNKSIALLGSGTAMAG